MKITILTYLPEEGAKDRDIVVDQVARALRAGGHTPSILGVHGDLGKLISGLRRRKPELVFNLLEMFGTNVRGDVAVAGLLDLMALRYTGGGPGEFYLQEDKGLTKKLLAFDGIRFPEFAVFPKGGDPGAIAKLTMPLIVKPLRMDASIGIDAKAIVANEKDALKRLDLRLSRLLRRARLGRIESVLGRKRALEVEIEAINSGILPQGAFDSLNAERFLQDNEEYWPFEGDDWPDEFVGGEQAR